MFYGALGECDQYRLGTGGRLADRVGDAADVGLLEWSGYLVEHSEGSRSVLRYGQEHREGYQLLFAATHELERP